MELLVHQSAEGVEIRSREEAVMLQNGSVCITVEILPGPQGGRKENKMT